MFTDNLPIRKNTETRQSRQSGGGYTAGQSVHSRGGGGLPKSCLLGVWVNIFGQMWVEGITNHVSKPGKG